MKSKLSKILGVGLTVAVLASLLVATAPATPASAGVGTLQFENIPLPKFGSSGSFVLTPGSDVGPIAAAPSGNVMFASSNITASANITDLLKSSDNGYTWTQQTGFRTAANAYSDTTCIVDIVLSPQFATDGSLFVATEKNVYQSIDGGTVFAIFYPSTYLGASEVITDIDAAIDRGGRLSVIIGTSTGSDSGKVVAMVPSTTGMLFVTQSTGTWTAADVLAVGFSAAFASDEGIFAIAENSTDTTFRAAFGRTATGGGWGTAIGNATFRDPYGVSFAATRARMAFPSDFNATAIGSNIVFAGLYAGTPGDTTTEKGDVYKVTLQSLVSAATDMNVRGIPSVLTPTATNIWSIAVKGTAAAASIMVGTDYWTVADPLGVNYFTAYYSNDSGVTWANAREKSPTGGARGYDTTMVSGIETQVVMAADFATSKVAWAGTAGVETSAISRTSTGGKSWNQISMIDLYNTTDNYTVSVIKADSAYAKTQTLWIWAGASYTDIYGVSSTKKGALLKTINGGLNWEVFFSYANPTTTEKMHNFSITADGSTFAYDKYGGKVWRSSDGGASWPTIINTYGGFVAGSFNDANTIWTCAYGGAIWWTTNGGLTWVKPDESIVTGYPIAFSFGSAGKIILIGNSAGTVFISTDSGKTFKSRLGVTDAGASSAYAGFDPGYATNKFVYCTIGYGAVAGGGIWRIAVNEADPDTTLWQRIDGNEANSALVKPTVAFDLLGVFYCWDAATVGGGAGGIWRSVNPRDDPLGLYPPKFETVVRGLPTGTKLAYAGYAVAPNTIFAFLKSDTTTVLYYNQLVAMADTLSTGVTLDTPADKAANIGISTSTESLVISVSLAWKVMTGATTYHVQIATDSAFVSKVSEFSTSATTEQIVGILLPGSTYYWRVRVGSYVAGVTTGAPLISPWSATRSFTTGVPYALALKIVSPSIGAMDVPVLPTFVWTAVPGVTTYELVVSEDPTFAIIDWSRTSDKAYFQADEQLAYSTTYYWRVRQSGGTWVNGVFTTQAQATTPPPPFTFTSVPPPTITVVPGPTTEAVPGYLLWIIIAIGAILVIALIVLIVRTRRSA